MTSSTLDVTGLGDTFGCHLFFALLRREARLCYIQRYGIGLARYAGAGPWEAYQ